MCLGKLFHFRSIVEIICRHLNAGRLGTRFDHIGQDAAFTVGCAGGDFTQIVQQIGTFLKRCLDIGPFGLGGFFGGRNRVDTAGSETEPRRDLIASISALCWCQALRRASF